MAQNDYPLMGYLAAKDGTQWRRATKFPPPRGVKMLIRTTGDQCIIGHWRSDSNYVGWAPMPAGWLGEGDDEQG